MRDISSYMPSSFMISTVRGQSVIPAPAVVMASCASYMSMGISRPANFPIVMARTSPPMPAPLHRKSSLLPDYERHPTYQIATRNLGLPDESDIEDISAESSSTVGQVAPFYATASTGEPFPPQLLVTHTTDQSSNFYTHTRPSWIFIPQDMGSPPPNSGRLHAATTGARGLLRPEFFMR
jgi:hypothetical protein